MSSRNVRLAQLPRGLVIAQPIAGRSRDTVEELSRVLSVTRNPVSAVRVRLVVHRLRKELAPFGGNVILTLRGQGYRFQP